MDWKLENLRSSALGISASRRTDVPGLFGAWFEKRLEEGFVEYIPAGPPRRIRASIRPEDVTHFTFWTKWPRPFFPALLRVLAVGYPVLFNVTITGLGGTPVEPHVPPAVKGVAAVAELSKMVSPAAILWRYDPIFISGQYDATHHIRIFERLAGELAGRVDRVACSFVEPYGRRVKPDLAAYEAETEDGLTGASVEEKVDLLRRLQEIAGTAGIPFTICCSKEVRSAIGAPRSGCNAWSWACRVYPDLQSVPALADRPMRKDCGCSREIDIGVYDTCVYGCRYSYGSCSLAAALQNHARHDPSAPCLIP